MWFTCSTGELASPFDKKIKMIDTHPEKYLTNTVDGPVVPFIKVKNN